ncbi:MAG: sensor histidine kinase [Gammaproteobacteria bacterium]|nr:sensor histidine kinase [Gammaproteobacteria bacterium]
MKLRTQVNLIVGSLSAVFIAAMLLLEIGRTRLAVSEEIAAANTVATQLLSRVAQTYERDGALPLLLFLKHLGRVRANEITLLDANGQVLYRSPPPTYKAGREAPQWYARLLLPPTSPRVFPLAGGAQLQIEANASRAVLDGWDDFVQLLWVGGLGFTLLNVLVFWLVGRVLAPLPAIASGLERIENGELSYRLPPMKGHEAALIGAAFNRMAAAVADKHRAELEARTAQARLEERRELSQLIEQRLDEERRAIARELHDEFAQSVTAIRTLAVAIIGRGRGDDGTLGAAQAISHEAARLYDAMHSLIPRLAPISLDTLGLAETLQGLVAEWQKRTPNVRISLEQELPSSLGSTMSLALYRVVQEALMNALRHAQADEISIRIRTYDDHVTVRVVDNGRGLSGDWMRPGSFGIRGLRERVLSLNGSFHIGNRSDTSGVEVVADIPLVAEPIGAVEERHDTRATG